MPTTTDPVTPEADLRELLTEVANEAFDRGFVSASGGNISARIPGTDRVLIKPTGARLRGLAPSDLVLLNLNGTVLKGPRIPSKEWRLHVGIYRAREDVGAILHTHSPATTAFACIGESVPLLTEQARSVLQEVPLVSYAPPGSPKLAKLVVRAFSNNVKVKAVLLERHGSVVVGKNLIEALNHADLLEEEAKVAIFAKHLRR